jgi:hypothetical protein
MKNVPYKSCKDAMFSLQKQTTENKQLRICQMTDINKTDKPIKKVTGNVQINDTKNSGYRIIENPRKINLTPAD